MASLNANQARAVDWGTGPLLVLAGPGSGKTLVLTRRMARIISDSAEKSFCILGLTFTNKAAVEMRRRMGELAADPARRVNLTTYHSFSASILRQHGHLLGIRPDFEILTQDAERMAVLDAAIAKAASIRYSSRRLLPLITRLTDQNVAADGAAEFLREEMPQDAQYVGDVYRHYRRLMIENGELDYGCMVAEAIRLLTDTPAARLVRIIYPYVCVDEFQDTSQAEYQLLCRLVNPSTRNLFVVADGDQTIFEWNGADPRRLWQLQRQFDMTVLDLPENYRCPPKVVDMANMLITNNPEHCGAVGVASKPEEAGDTVRVMNFETAEEEAGWIAKDIAGRPADERGRCAVLSRNRWVLESVVSALKEHGISGHLHVRKSEFVDNRMVWLHSTLRLANSRQDGEQLRRVCRSFYVLEGINLAAADIASEAMMTDGDYLRAWTRAALRERLDPLARSFLEESMQGLSHRLNHEEFARDCFEWFERRQKSNPEPDYETEYIIEKDVWDGLTAEIADDIVHKQTSLSALLQHIDLHSKEPPVPKGAVQCYTIFASKGMEFDHTYLIRLVEGDLPDRRAVSKGNTSRELCEERRVCFVAVTRTQKTLTLTYPRHVSGSAREPSRFLAEMGADQYLVELPAAVNEKATVSS